MLDFFEKIVCINLDERNDRWASVQREFVRAELGNRVERFSAIKNALGHIGCRDSHLAVIQSAKQNDLGNILILEDDIVFSDDCVEYLKQALIEIEQFKEWHILYLGANVDPGCTHLKKVSPTLVQTDFALATHAYLINSSAFTQIIDLSLIHI